MLYKYTLLILTAASLSLFGVKAEADRSLAEGFGKMTLQSAGQPWSHNRVRFQDGTRGEKFELRAGDCESRYTDDCRTDRERVEFFERSPGQRKDTEWWYTWSVYLPADFPNTGGVLTKLGQFHQRGKSGPELMFELTRGSLQLTMPDPFRWDTDPMNPIPHHRILDIWPRSKMIGRWTTVTMRARWSADPSGYYQIWINDQFVDSYNGQTTNDPKGEIYFKYGIYRSFVERLGGGNKPPTLVVYYRDVKRTRTRNALEQ